MSTLQRLEGMPRAEAIAAIQNAIRTSATELAELSVGLQMLMIGADAVDLAPAPISAPAKRDREIENCILEAAPGPDELRVSRKELARRAGYAYHGHFRKAVTALVEANVLTETTKGVRRSS